MPCSAAALACLFDYSSSLRSFSYCSAGYGYLRFSAFLFHGPESALRASSPSAGNCFKVWLTKPFLGYALSRRPFAKSHIFSFIVVLSLSVTFLAISLQARSVDMPGHMTNAQRGRAPALAPACPCHAALRTSPP